MSAYPGIAAERDIDHLITLLCTAESELHLCQRDLLEIRREGPRATRANSATGTLQLCRLNRRQARRAAADMCARYARGTV